MSANASSKPAGRHGAWAMIICALLLMTFASVAWLAALGKSATYDEPLDVIEAWANTRLGDYRICPADPALWSYWAGLPLGRNTITADLNSPAWKEAITDIRSQYGFATDTLYRTSGNDADTLLRRSRAMMLILGVLIGVIVACWSWKLGGATAAVAATTCFCLDPNFLAHAPLVKNDVSIALVAIAMLAMAWSVGRAARVWNIALLALLCGVAVCVKYTGVVLVLALIALLLARAWIPLQWSLAGRPLRRITSRLGGAGIIAVCCVGVSYPCIWACYRFRASPTPDPSTHLGSEQVARECISIEMILLNPTHKPRPEEVAARRPPISLRLALFAERHRLFPEAWTNGFILTYTHTRLRSAYLMGSVRVQGWWYFFPLAMLFKTPLATLLAMLLIVELIVRGCRVQPATAPAGWWSALCIAVPVLVIALAAMTNRIDIGIRHVLLLYPFLYVSVGVAFAHVLQWRRLAGIAIGMALALGLAAETVCRFPNYIDFFNVAAGGWRGGLDLLGDSNLDWGQDLPLLRRWQENHPDKPIYLDYFGSADPDYYHIKYIKLSDVQFRGRGDWKAGLDPNGVIAISATQLQGIYLFEYGPPQYSYLRRSRPLDVLGGSIYIYDVSALR